ncbi:MAG: MarR family winged helix-turn-helix transcriptional regulator [Peptostreptococcaceae bacterium]
MKKHIMESVGRYIGHFYRYGQSFLSKEYKSYNIGPGQYQILIMLYLQDGISHEELTEKMSVDKATTTRAIMKLEQEGYVERSLNENDKRKYNIYLTEKALEKKDEIFKISVMWEDRLTGCLTEEEIDNLILTLRKIANNMNISFIDELDKETNSK